MNTTIMFLQSIQKFLEKQSSLATKSLIEQLIQEIIFDIAHQYDSEEENAQAYYNAIAALYGLPEQIDDNLVPIVLSSDQFTILYTKKSPPNW